MLCDYLIFWHRHNQEPELTQYEQLLFCSRTPQKGFDLAPLAQWWKRKRKVRRSA